MTLKSVLDKTTDFFRSKGSTSPRLDAELLLGAGLNLTRMDLYLRFDQPVTETDLAKCRDLVRRRGQGEPVAYLLGSRGFFGHDFVVNPDVLIPRPETEMLVEWGIEKLSGVSAPKVLDLGCGTGCIGLSLAATTSAEVQLTLVDVSPKALLVAKHNHSRLVPNVATEFVVADATVALPFPKESFDLIVANPPYISRTSQEVEDSVLRFEPALALFADEDGFAIWRGFAKSAQALLKPGAWLGMEIGHDQSERAIEFLHHELGMQNVSMYRDLAGHPRMVVGCAPNSLALPANQPVP